jgi:hypothetical protein
MRSLGGVPDTDLVALGEDVIDRHVQIRKAHQMPSHAPFQAIAPDDLPVDGKLGSEQLIDDGEVLPVEAFFYPPTNEGLVLGADAFSAFDWLALTTGNDG